MLARAALHWHTSSQKQQLDGLFRCGICNAFCFSICNSVEVNGTARDYIHDGSPVKKLETSYFMHFFQRVRLLSATLCILKPLACNLLRLCLVAQQRRINTLKKRLLDQRMMRFLGTCNRRKVHSLRLLFRVAIDR